MKVTARKASVVFGCLAWTAAASAAVIPQLLLAGNPAGIMETYNINGPTDARNPFFQSLGTNGRSCATCHIATDAFGLSVEHVQRLFGATQGEDPLFADVDGANCPGVAPNDSGAHSLLLEHGLIRVALAVPPSAQFTITAVHDPYGCASVTDPRSGQQIVSVYRRPLPTTNLPFLSAVMFDGRETVLPLNDPQTFHANLVTDLEHQAVDATLGHAQASGSPTPEQQAAIVTFELGQFSAELFDKSAGLLSADRASGGALPLSQQPYYPGVNDSLGKDPTGAAFTSNVFGLFEPWASIPDSTSPSGQDAIEARRAIAAGEAIFNSRPLTIANVRGLNAGSALSFQGTCSTCHDTPNVGDHSLPLPLDIGTGHDPTRETDALIGGALALLDFPDLPVYQVSGCPNPFGTAQAGNEPYVVYTTDPGKALITGLCSDVNRIKGPILRGLAARAPYFHNGAARDLGELVNFYNERFHMNLSHTEKFELIAFLNSL